MNGRTRVLVSCSNRILTEAIARILSKKSEFETISATTTGFDGASDIIALEPEVAVLDSLEMFVASTRPDSGAPSGWKPNCVLVAMEDDHRHFLKAIQNGVRGYVLRDASALEVISAIRAVVQGQASCPPSYMRILFDYVAAECRPSTVTEVPWELTRREQQIVPLIGRGHTNKEIANVLSLSEQTVKNHIHRMMRKMQSSSRVDVCNTWLRQSGSSLGGYPRAHQAD